MAVPKKKTSQSKRGMRRSHDFIRIPKVFTCPNCGAPIIPHNVCKKCNFYKGRNVLLVQETSDSKKV